jgi:hypothetical protein
MVTETVATECIEASLRRMRFEGVVQTVSFLSLNLSFFFSFSFYFLLLANATLFEQFTIPTSVLYCREFLSSTPGYCILTPVDQPPKLDKFPLERLAPKGDWNRWYSRHLASAASLSSLLHLHPTSYR